MIPLAAELKRRGHQVILGVDKSLIPLVSSELPEISITEIRGVRIRYSRHLPQYLCIFLQLPRIIASSVSEYYHLRRLASRLQPDLIISDSRFGFRHRKICSVYVTHQLRIAFPKWLRLMEPLGERIHRMIISSFDLCLVPDYPGPVNLSGRLSHDLPLPENICYCGPLSRFGTVISLKGGLPASASGSCAASDSAGPSSGAITTASQNTCVSSAADTVPGSDTASATPSPFASPSFHASSAATTRTSANPATSAATTRTSANPATSPAAGKYPPVQPYCCLILSGPEPQRTILLEKVTAAVTEMPLVILSATPLHPKLTVNQEITVVTNPDTATMKRYLVEASRIIARAGYTTIMELMSLRRGAILIPTPGQTEQEYLGRYLNRRLGFVTVSQEDIRPSELLRYISPAGTLTGIYGSPADLLINSNPDDNSVEPPGGAFPDRNTEYAREELPDAAPLLEKALEKALDMLPEKKKE